MQWEYQGMKAKNTLEKKGVTNQRQLSIILSSLESFLLVYNLDLGILQFSNL